MSEKETTEKFWGGVWKFTQKYAHLFISGGLVLASSGLDGVYMSLWTPGAPILGYVLNLAADITNMYLSERVGKLLRSKSNVKQAGAIFLFTGEIVAIAYSWLFSWRQLLRVLPSVEPDDYHWLAPIIAGAIPALLSYLSISSGLDSVSSNFLSRGLEQAESLWPKIKKALQESEDRLRGEFANSHASSRRAPTESARTVLERDGWHCFYCGVEMINWRSDKIHVDHFYPVSKGGSDDPLNLVVSCKQCNLSKSAKEPTAEQVRSFKVHLVKREKISAKDKVLLLHRLGLLTKQKDIATTLNVSPSYVSSVMRDSERELSEAAQEIQEQLEAVGKPMTIVTELPGGNGHKQQEKQLESVS